MKRLIELVLASALLSFAWAQATFYSNPVLNASATSQLAPAVPNPGYWGVVPPATANPFNSAWDQKGFQQMYNLNSRTSFAGGQGSGFDAMTPVFNPIGPTRFEFFPTQSNFLSPGELGAYQYDVNEPRMRQIVKNYFRFFNRDLDRLSSLTKDNTRRPDLNNSEERKLKLPSMFDYKTYFDGFNDEWTTPSGIVKTYKVRDFFPEKDRMLYLKAPLKKMKKLATELGRQSALNNSTLQRIENIGNQVKRIERKLALMNSLNSRISKQKEIRRNKILVGTGKGQNKFLPKNRIIFGNNNQLI